MIRAVTFDASGTLIAPREPIGETYARVAGRFGIAADPMVVERAFRRAFLTAPPLAFPGAPADAIPDLERAWWRRMVRSALAVADDDPRFDACFAELFAHYGRSRAWRLHSDVIQTLADLRARKLRLAVISNFDGRLPAVLDGLGVARSFDAIVWSTAVGAAKPAAAIFHAAARALGLDIAATCHVGDDPDLDVTGARAAGARAIPLDRTCGGPDSLTSLADLPGRLAGLHE